MSTYSHFSTYLGRFGRSENQSANLHVRQLYICYDRRDDNAILINIIACLQLPTLFLITLLLFNFTAGQSLLYLIRIILNTFYSS